MNLVCNNCIGARMYELSNEQFTGFIRWTDPTIDKMFGEKIKL